MENNWYDMYLQWINNQTPDLPPISEPPPTTAPFPTATPGGSPYPVTGNPFGPQPVFAPPPGQGLDFPGANTPMPPPYQNRNAGTEAVSPTLGLPPDLPADDQTPSTVATGAGIPSGGQGNRQDDSGQVPGVDLGMRDRVNEMLHNLGLPPLPTNYDPFGGLPAGWADLTRASNLEHGTGFNTGAPVFSMTGGPQWSGGSIFGGTFANRGGFTPGSFAPVAGEAAMLPATFQMAMSRGIWGGRNPMTPENFNNWRGWLNYQGNALQGAKFAGPVTRANMSYQDYLNTWNQLRSSGRTGGAAYGMSPAALINAGAGSAAHGNKPFAAAGGGVVPDDDSSDFYANIGRPVYGALRKGEDVSKNVFHALGELGKYLQAGVPNADTASMIPSVRGTPRPRPSFSVPPSPDALLEWMLTPQTSEMDRVRRNIDYEYNKDQGGGTIPLPGYRDRTGPFRLQAEPPTTGRFLPGLYDSPAGTRLAGLGGIYNPDFPPWAPGTGPWRLKQEPRDSGVFMPQLYDTRASGALLAYRGAVVPSMGMTSRGMRGSGMSGYGLPSMGERSGESVRTDTVPAMLTPGEVVLNDQQQQAVMPVPGREHMLRKDQRARLAKSWLT